MSFLEKLKKNIEIRLPEKKTKKLKKKGAKKEEIKIKDEKWFELEGELVLDVFQTNGEIVVEAPVAGVKTEDLDIVVEGDTIRIKGRREKPQKVEQRNYLFKECYWGPFSREIILPVELDGSKVEASIKEGILVIKAPKIKRKKERKIKVKEK